MNNAEVANYCVGEQLLKFPQTNIICIHHHFNIIICLKEVLKASKKGSPDITLSLRPIIKTENLCQFKLYIYYLFVYKAPDSSYWL